MLKRVSCTVLFLLLVTVCFAQDDEDHLSKAELLWGIKAGAVVGVIGFILQNIKAIKGLGTGLLFLAAFLAGVPILILILELVSTIVSFAFKIAIYLAIAAAVIWVISQIYTYFAGEKK
ncbi:hypothetical protein [Flaviaesturariibacter aridisoli]|uniref:Phage holin family protein n=1 Tax=Flaviaesturariibacter aridisoli TaxID=2545761 RepID=A0A4R4E6G5_9BACT|nr:hypothetical protein [Flaviaesturariibacter aridisoli]TCZ73275.1 hypothetical protein E0486_06270 [Flaviaesturariibacter aridisoli]